MRYRRYRPDRVADRRADTFGQGENRYDDCNAKPLLPCLQGGIASGKRVPHGYTLRCSGHSRTGSCIGKYGRSPWSHDSVYLYRDGRDLVYRIHGTVEPWTIGENISSGCIRMLNEDVIDLFSRAPAGTRVSVLEQVE